MTPEQTARHLRRMAEQEQAQGRARAARLRGHLPRAVRLLREDYGATAVVLFGSLTTGQATRRSDVDLAVRGLDGARYFAALGELMAVFGAAVDRVRLEEAPESLRERIVAEGEGL